MNLILLVVSLFVILSCQNIEHVSEQCIVDMVNEKCLCRKYEFKKEHVGAIANSTVEHDLLYCEKLVGFKDYVETATFWELVRKQIKECKK